MPVEIVSGLLAVGALIAAAATIYRIVTRERKSSSGSQGGGARTNPENPSNLD